MDVVNRALRLYLFMGAAYSVSTRGSRGCKNASMRFPHPLFKVGASAIMPKPKREREREREPEPKARARESASAKEPCLKGIFLTKKIDNF